MSMLDADQQWKLRSPTEFASFFQKQLNGVLGELETERKAVARKLVYLIAAVVSLAVAAGIAAVAFTQAPPAAILVLIIAAAIVAFGWHAITKDFRQNFKHHVVSAIIRFFGDDLKYTPWEFIPERRFLQSQIFRHRVDRYRGEDYLTGKAGQTAFECSEIHAEYKTTTVDSKGRRRTHWHTIFKGLFFIGDFHKHFNGLTVVLPDVAEASFGWLGQKLQEMNFSAPGELVKLEDPEFEKRFVVYATDQIEARYILSPSLMRRIVEFRDRLGDQCFLSFLGGTVYVAIKPSRDLFEPSIFKPIDYDCCWHIYEDIALALGIIQELNLNTRIWTKQ